MRVPSRLVAVVSFVAIGMLALVVAGLLDWIVGVLFLTMEFLGEFLRNVFLRRRPPSRSRRAATVPPHAVGHHHRPVRRRRPRRGRPAPETVEPTLTPAPAPPARRSRILVLVRGDEPGLLDFALEECRGRQAEMVLLFVRPLAVIPMGPTPLPGLSEDSEARALFDRIGLDAGRAGVPLRTVYEATDDLPATLGEVARVCEPDVVLVGSPRRTGLSRFLTRDLTPSLIRRLPERASLTIRAS